MKQKPEISIASTGVGGELVQQAIALAKESGLSLEVVCPLHVITYPGIKKVKAEARLWPRPPAGSLD